MQKSLSLWQLAGFIFTLAAGTLLHFLYDWTNQSILFAPFSAVNESVWEHMKLLFFPMFLFALVENQRFGEQYEHFWCAKLAGILLGLILIPVLFYTYTGVFGVSLHWANIGIFFLASAAAYLLETRLLRHNRIFCHSPQAALFVLCLLALAFMVFTFVHPYIPLFEEPTASVFGFCPF